MLFVFAAEADFPDSAHPDPPDFRPRFRDGVSGFPGQDGEVQDWNIEESLKSL